VIDKAKIALIKVAQKQLGMADTDYRALLLRVAGVRSSTELDEARFTAVMAEFARLGFESTANKERRLEAGRFGTHATYQQRKKIAAMWSAWKGRADEEGLNRWLENKFHVANPRFLSRELAAKAIAALGNFKPHAAQLNENRNTAP
jgi:phage gp16-like protein